MTAQKSANFIEQRDGTYYINGKISEETSLAALSQTVGVVRLNFAKLTGINSVGVSKMLSLVQSRNDARFEYHECPWVLIDAINQIPRLLGPKADPAVIKSLFLPMECGSCKTEIESLTLSSQVSISGNSVMLAPISCPQCGLLMRLSGDPEEFFYYRMARP